MDGHEASTDSRLHRNLTAAAEPLPELDGAERFGARFDRFATSRVVLLGESSHGTSEFYRARAAITRRLVERHGFTIVAAEADWPDAAQVDCWVRDRPGAEEPGGAFARFPEWMWRNAEMRDFATWLRAHNASRPSGERVEFRGLDIYSLASSIESVLAYLDVEDPEAARQARRRYDCLSPWQGEPEEYGKAMFFSNRPGCEQAVLAQLQDMLKARLDAAAGDDEALFDATQNARVVQSAEQYYRLMYRSSAESWNLRDTHMFETLKAVLDQAGPTAKAVVWAHNSHIGNASATEMGSRGETNIGEMCRAAFGSGAALIGFGTDRGTVAAAHDWGGPMQVMQVRPGLAGSYEAAMRDARLPPRALLDLPEPCLREALASPRLERAIGVIYRPETERRSHYFEAVLPDQFDAFVWFAETRAVSPLDMKAKAGAADTFPSGL